jgi:hypothetical protein
VGFVDATQRKVSAGSFATGSRPSGSARRSTPDGISNLRAT